MDHIGTKVYNLNTIKPPEKADSFQWIRKIKTIVKTFKIRKCNSSTTYRNSTSSSQPNVWDGVKHWTSVWCYYRKTSDSELAKLSGVCRELTFSNDFQKILMVETILSEIKIYRSLSKVFKGFLKIK